MKRNVFECYFLHNDELILCGILEIFDENIQLINIASDVVRCLNGQNNMIVFDNRKYICTDLKNKWKLQVHFEYPKQVSYEIVFKKQKESRFEPTEFYSYLLSFDLKINKLFKYNCEFDVFKNHVKHIFEHGVLVLNGEIYNEISFDDKLITVKSWKGYKTLTFKNWNEVLDKYLSDTQSKIISNKMWFKIMSKEYGYKSFEPNS